MSSEDKKDGIGAAIGRIPSGVFIVTAADDELSTALLASWVQQVAFEPPLIAVAVKEGRPIRALIESSNAFVVNVLAEGQNSILGHFAAGFGPDEDAFDGIATSKTAGGAAILTDALAHIDCKLHSSMQISDHILFVGEAVGGELQGEDPPYVHLRKSGFSY